MKFSKLIKKALKFLFPINLTCNVCGKEIFHGGYFCEQCEKDLPRNNGAICNHCGRKVLNAEERCLSCKGRETYYEKSRSVYSYETPINELIASLKYGGKRYLADVFANDMAFIYFSNYFNCDYCISVPMSKERLKERGYNQSDLLAESLAEKVGIEFKKDILIKHRETQRQATLSAKEREKNLEGSFKVVNEKEVRDKRILIIDDISTTGATVETISKLLKKHGAESVLVLTVASVSKEMLFARKNVS